MNGWSPLKESEDGAESADKSCPGDGLPPLENENESLAETKERLEENIAEREATIRSIYHAVFQPVMTIDDDARIECANTATQKLFGYDEEALVGSELADLLPALGSGDGAMERLRSPELESGLETEAVRSDGSRFPVHIAANEGEAQGHRVIAVMVRDLREVERARIKALRAERLAAIGETIAGLAHESRNALQRLQASISLLELKARGDAELTALAGDMQEAQDQLHALYEEVRNYAAPISLERTPCDIKTLLNETWGRLALSHEPKRLSLTIVGAEHDTRVSVDVRRMEQVLRNVLENAIDASPPEGRIVAKFESPDALDSDRLQIALRGSGSGFDQDQADKIFEPFYTTKSRGTGLGLPIARKIVEAHGGEIIAAPIGDGGAEVRLTLPR